MRAAPPPLPEPRRPDFRVARWLVRRLRAIVPADLRRRWVAEWEAEIWYRAAHGHSLRPALAALPHAASLRRQQWSLDAMFQDFRYAFRQTRKAPVLSAMIVLTMALGIGINSLVYGVLSSTVLDPLPFEDAERIVYLWREHPRNSWWMSPQMEHVAAWREQVGGLEEIVTMRGRTFTVSGLEEPTRVNGAQVSPRFFDFMGVSPAIGRIFTAEETAAGEPVAIISHRTWQQHFGGREDALGATLRIDYRPHTVIGVMPAWFKMQSPFALAQIWTPLEESSAGPGVNAIGRLRVGTTVAQVNAELKALEQERIAAAGGEQTSITDTWIGQARRPQDFLDGDFRSTVWALQGAVAVVLLIATANVVNLLLARGSIRQQEMAVRAAIGGSRLRLVRQLMTESMLLTVSGGALGLGLAAAGVSLLDRFRPADLDGLDTLRFDPTVALVTLAVTLVAGLLAGLLPALQGARGDLQAQMAALSGRTSESGSQSRARGLLVVAEIALSTILVVGAGLLVGSFVHLQQIDPGFEAERLLTMRVGVPDRFAEDQGGYWAEVLQSVRTALGPRAELVTLSAGVPPSGGVEFGSPQPERGEVATTVDGITSVSFVQPEYFEAMGIELLAGTTLPDATEGDETPMVVNEEFALQVWGHANVVGERVRYGDDEPWRRVVGVVGSVRAFGLMSDLDQRQVYYGFKLDGGAERLGEDGLALTVRTTEDPIELIPTVRRAIWAVDDEAPITDVASLHERMADSIALPRFNAWLMSSLAFVALGLAIVGVYGVLSYSVARRRHELGVRMALGATRTRLLGLVGRTSLALVGSGLLVGIAGSVAASRLLASMLHGVEPTDPRAYLAATVVLLLVGFVATWRPALRAAGVDPAVALRDD